MFYWINFCIATRILYFSMVIYPQAMTRCMQYIYEGLPILAIEEAILTMCAYLAEILLTLEERPDVLK